MITDRAEWFSVSLATMTESEVVNAFSLVNYLHIPTLLVRNVKLLMFTKMLLRCIDL